MIGQEFGATLSLSATIHDGEGNRSSCYVGDVGNHGAPRRNAQSDNINLCMGGSTKVLKKRKVTMSPVDSKEILRISQSPTEMGLLV